MSGSTRHAPTGNNRTTDADLQSAGKKYLASTSSVMLCGIWTVQQHVHILSEVAYMLYGAANICMLDPIVLLCYVHTPACGSYAFHDYCVHATVVVLGCARHIAQDQAGKAALSLLVLLLA